ncbi:MAG: alpha/beta fold hydrolase [Schleiferiaceae bacterium]|nr:alpha/beta fold hydrolase [Schleiferiaceae bacterium]MDR9441805.1 alpha/beta fold hydrolase [Schleiferiaceae bacterium]
MAASSEKRSFVLPPYITVPMYWLSRYLPALATRLALYLFFRPLRFPVPEREKPIRARMKKYELQTAKGDPFTAWRLGETGPPVILMHGWSGRGSQFFDLIDRLAPHYQVCALDAPGHGAHQGKPTHMLAFVEALEVADAQFGPFQHGIGHSLGGMVLFNGFPSQINFQTLSVIGTPAHVDNVVGDFCEKINAHRKVYHRIIQYIEKRYQLKTADVSTNTLSRQYPCPGIIAHDEEDVDVPAANAHELHQAWPAAQLFLSQGYGHRRILSHPALLQAVEQLLKQEGPVFCTEPNKKDS